MLHAKLSKWYLHIRRKMILVLKSLGRQIWRKIMKNILEQICSRRTYKDLGFCQKIKICGSNFTVKNRNDFLVGVHQSSKFDRKTIHNLAGGKFHVESGGALKKNRIKLCPNTLDLAIKYADGNSLVIDNQYCLVYLLK